MSEILNIFIEFRKYEYEYEYMYMVYKTFKFSTSGLQRIIGLINKWRFFINALKEIW